MNKLTLIIDDRERAVFPHLKAELIDVPYRISRINVGDYAAVMGNEKLIAVFERKTYEDFASSIKDGRYLNKQDLIDARNRTGCTIYYIVEGKAFPNATDTFERFPYSTIESAIDHLIMRDGFQVIFTRDTQHTIARLNRFMKSMCSLLRKNELPDGENKQLNVLPSVNVPTGGPTGGPIGGSSDLSSSSISGSTSGSTGGSVENMQQAINYTGYEEYIETGHESIRKSESSLELIQCGLPNILTQRNKKETIDVVRELWSKFSGISTVSADRFINRFSIADIIYGQRRDELRNMKYTNGKSISKRVIHSLTHITERNEQRLLATIPGISEAMARDIISQHRLRSLLSYEPDAISIIRTGKLKSKLGIEKAKRIIEYMNYTLRNEGADACF